MTDPKVLILYGGVFDPVHEGHLSVAQQVSEAIDRPVTLLPCAVPSHGKKPMASFEDRVRMLELATGQHQVLSVEAIEGRLPSPNYSVVTLRHFFNRGITCVFLVGADAIAGFSRWHRWQEISQIAHLVVVNRPSAPLSISSEVLASFGGKLVDLDRIKQQLNQPVQSAGMLTALEISPHPASSTAIRNNLLQTGQSNHLSEAVSQYILEKALYKIAD